MLKFTWKFKKPLSPFYQETVKGIFGKQDKPMPKEAVATGEDFKPFELIMKADPTKEELGNVLSLVKEIDLGSAYFQVIEDGKETQTIPSEDFDLEIIDADTDFEIVIGSS